MVPTATSAGSAVITGPAECSSAASKAISASATGAGWHGLGERMVLHRLGRLIGGRHHRRGIDSRGRRSRHDLVSPGGRRRASRPAETGRPAPRQGLRRRRQAVDGGGRRYSLQLRRRPLPALCFRARRVRPRGSVRRLLLLVSPIGGAQVGRGSRALPEEDRGAPLAVSTFAPDFAFARLREAVLYLFTKDGFANSSKSSP
jgi:hypothetical protein